MGEPAKRHQAGFPANAFRLKIQQPHDGFSRKLATLHFQKAVSHAFFRLLK